jgi:hypothetical protein
MALQEIPIVQIRTDGGTQIRTSTYFDKIAEYAEAIADGIDFPPLTVFFDGEDYWLADGFHRLAAHKAVGDAIGATHLHVLCEVVEGSQAAAILCACGANAEHGIQRTDDDKRAAVDVVLKNPLVSVDPLSGEPWTDRRIARVCNVNHHLVAKRRLLHTGSAPSKRAFVHHRTGKPSVMKTGGINKDRGEAKEQAAADKAADHGESEAKAEPTPFKQSTEWDHLFTLIRQVDEAIAALPAPEVAAANFPISLAHALPLDRVVVIKKWWLDFARFWEARDPEIQKHRQSVRDFIQEQENNSVAAE